MSEDAEEIDPKVARKKAREQTKIRARKPQRVTYDLPPALRERVKGLAGAECLPASQLVTLALLRFLKDYTAGEVRLSQYKTPSRSPRYDWNLSYPQELLRMMRSSEQTGKKPVK